MLISGISAGDLPLALALHPDGRHLLVSNNGQGDQSIDVIYVAARKRISRTPVKQAWLGLAISGDGMRVFAGGGISNTVTTFTFVVNGRTPSDPGYAHPGQLQGHIDPYYRGWDLEYSDLERVTRFPSELQRFEREGEMPRFQVGRLPNDHTMGTRPGALTSRPYVAQNDAALGILIEGISRSRFWKDTAVFTIEDDAQNGLDHVDAHRTVAMVISPHSRRRGVDSTMYSTSSMLSTIELILGLPPMSQYDAAAAPMFASLGATPVMSPYKALPARISRTAVNPPDAPGSAQAMQMDFDEEDAAPEIEFNALIWMSIRGKDSTTPAPVRLRRMRIHKQHCASLLRSTARGSFRAGSPDDRAAGMASNIDRAAVVPRIADRHGGCGRTRAQEDNLRPVSFAVRNLRKDQRRRCRPIQVRNREGRHKEVAALVYQGPQRQSDERRVGSQIEHAGGEIPRQVRYELPNKAGIMPHPLQIDRAASRRGDAVRLEGGRGNSYGLPPRVRDRQACVVTSRLVDVDARACGPGYRGNARLGGQHVSLRETEHGGPDRGARAGVGGQQGPADAGGGGRPVCFHLIKAAGRD
jgi:hypothetical protein